MRAARTHRVASPQRGAREPCRWAPTAEALGGQGRLSAGMAGAAECDAAALPPGRPATDDDVPPHHGPARLY
eukprot:9570830-Lingulodinium_polyedra.AAC.1